MPTNFLKINLVYRDSDGVFGEDTNKGTPLTYADGDSNIRNIKNFCTQVASSVNFIENIISTVENSNTAFQVTLNNFGTDLNLAKSRITSLENINSGSRLSALEAINAGSRLTSAEDAIVVLDGRADSLETRASTSETNITSLQQTSGNHETRIGTLETDLNLLEVEVQETNQRIDLITNSSGESLLDHEDRLDALEIQVPAGFNAVDLRLDSLETNTNNHEDRLDALEGTTSSHGTRITSLEGLVNSPFNYRGSITGGTIESPTDLSTLTYKSNGDYYRVSIPGYFTDLSAVTHYMNAQDAFIFAGNSIEKFDNTDTTITNGSAYLSIVGSTDEGYVVDLSVTSKAEIDKISSIETDVADHETRISAVEVTTSQAEIDIDAIQLDLIGKGTQISDHETRIDALEAVPPFDPTTINNQLTDHETRIGALEAVPPFDPTTINNQLTDHETRIGAIETTTSGHTTQIGDLETDVGNLQTTVGGHTTQIGDLETTTSGHTTQIGDLETTTSGHTTQITDLETTTSGHTTQISDLETTTSGHTTQITDLETDVADHETRIATLESTSTTLLYATKASGRASFTTTDPDQIVDSFDSTVLKTAKYIAQAELADGTMHASEILVTNNGTTVYITEYAKLNGGTDLVTYSADFNGTLIELYATPVNANTTITFARTAVKKV